MRGVPKSGKPRKPKGPLRQLLDPSKPIGPNQLVRMGDGPFVFGLRRSELEAAVERGEIPPPFKLTTAGRAKAWTGQQIIDWQAERVARAQAAAPKAKVPA